MVVRFRAPATLMCYFGWVFWHLALRAGSFKGSNIHVISLYIYLRHWFTLRSMVSKIRCCVAKHCIAHCCFADNSQGFQQLTEIIEAEGKNPY